MNPSRDRFPPLTSCWLFFPPGRSHGSPHPFNLLRYVCGRTHLYNVVVYHLSSRYLPYGASSRRFAASGHSFGHRRVERDAGRSISLVESRCSTRPRLFASSGFAGGPKEMEMSAADRSQCQYDVHKASWSAKTTSTSNGVPNGEAKRRKTTTRRSSKVSDR